jgi:hypothetical protein
MLDSLVSDKRKLIKVIQISSFYYTETKAVNEKGFYINFF